MSSCLLIGWDIFIREYQVQRVERDIYFPMSSYTYMLSDFQNSTILGLGANEVMQMDGEERRRKHNCIVQIILNVVADVQWCGPMAICLRESDEVWWWWKKSSHAAITRIWFKWPTYQHANIAYVCTLKYTHTCTSQHYVGVIRWLPADHRFM